jgi:hypothetical protein
LTVTRADENFHGLPSLLPDGRRFLYLRRGSDSTAGMYVGSLDVATPDDQPPERVMPALVAATVVPSSDQAGARVLFMSGTTLMTQPFDMRTLRLVGQPQIVAEQVGTGPSHAHFSASAGVLAYRVGEQMVDRGLDRAMWVDRKGQVRGDASVEGGPLVSLALSPDERHLVMQRRYGTASSETDLWMLDLDGDGREWTFTLSRDVSIIGAGVVAPVWSPDSRQVAYVAGGRILTKDASGAGAARDLGIEGAPLDWTDEFLVYASAGRTSAEVDILALPLADATAAPAPRVLITGPTFDSLGQVSPNGRWIAYASSRNSDLSDIQVYIRPFRPDAPEKAGDTVLRVSREGGYSPKWRADGKELFFLRRAGEFMSVEIDESADVPRPGVPTALFTLAASNAWDVSPDGQRFLVSAFTGGESQTPDTPISVVLNWEAALPH